MYKAILYKEWLKIRWFYLGMLVLAFAVLGNIFLDVSHQLVFMEAKGYWYNVIFRGYKFYSFLKYLPAIFGLVIATAQFVPEMTSKRLKLTFHLPVKENKLLIQMVSLGVVAITALFAFILVLLSGISAYYFPAEVVKSVVLTTLPWLGAGFFAYFTTVMIIIEPIWLKRIILGILSYSFIDTLFYSYTYNIYDRVLFVFLLICLLFSITILYSGYRFRKGVM